MKHCTSKAKEEQASTFFILDLLRMRTDMTTAPHELNFHVSRRQMQLLGLFWGASPQYFKPNFLWFDLGTMGLMPGVRQQAQRGPLAMVWWPT